MQFVECERYALAKEYLACANPANGFDLEIALTSAKGELIEAERRVILVEKGRFAGRDVTDLIEDALYWWDKELTFFEDLIS